MLRIAICDDDENDVLIVKNMTTQLLKKLDIDFEIEAYTNGDAIFKEFISFDLIFLDIEMDIINGYDLAKKIRTYDTNTKIIFITNSTEYLQVGYTVRPERYFVKPLNQDEFDYEMTTVLKEQIIDNKYILDERLGREKIYIKNIMYVEFFNRKTFLHMIDGEKPTSLRLKEWSALLKKYNFHQTHKSFLINLKHIKKIEKNDIVLRNEEILPLSRGYRNEFKDAYYKYIGNKI